MAATNLLSHPEGDNVRNWLADALTAAAEWRAAKAAEYPDDLRNARSEAALLSAADYVMTETISAGVLMFIYLADVCDRSGISLHSDGSGFPGAESQRTAGRYFFDNGSSAATPKSHETLLAELYGAAVADLRDVATAGTPLEEIVTQHIEDDIDPAKVAEHVTEILEILNQRLPAKNTNPFLDELGDVLQGTRQMIVAVPERYPGWAPKPGSAVARDLAAVLTGDREVDLSMNHHPRSVASLHLRTGAQCLAAAGLLVQQGEANLSPSVLARSAFENALRAYRVFDPEATPRQRVARALLDDIVSAHFRKLATGHLVGKNDESYKAATTILDHVRAHAERAFEVVVADDPLKWSVDGEAYVRPTKLARMWAEWRDRAGAGWLSANQAEGLYDWLCLYAHPQSFTSHPEALWGPDVEDPGFQTDNEIVGKLTLGAQFAILDVVGVFYESHGWESPEWEDLTTRSSALHASLP